jgi:hypothetical protein
MSGRKASPNPAQPEPTNRQGSRLQSPGLHGEPPEEGSKKLAASLEGFSLQAGTHVHERDRGGLKHLRRYAFGRH